MTSEFHALERQDLHLLVIDDDNRIRELLKSYLARQGFRVSTAANTMDARRLMEGLAFDLLILDVMMPDEDGVSFTKYLRERGTIPIILLTAKGEPNDRIAGLRAGADDYLAKPFEPEELVLRIDAIFRRLGSTVANSEVTFGPWSYDLDQHVLKKSGERVHLTTGEDALLLLLARMGGGSVSRHALSEKMNAKSERAVDVQMTRLRRKIEMHPSEPEFLITVRGTGYKLLTDKPA